MRLAIVGDVHLTETVPKARKDPDYLDTLLRKLDSIYSQCDVVVYLGDLFDKPTMSTFGLNKTLIFFLLKLREKKQSYIVMGNHDIPYLNPDSLEKSNLGTLDLIKMIHVVNEPVTIGPISISSIPMAAQVVCPKAPVGPEVHILIGHAFFENGLDPAYSVTREMLDGAGYDYVFLGHDHEPHEPVVLGDTEVHRIGSLCRNTSHEYQVKRIPRFFLFDIDGDVVTPMGLQTVPIKSRDEVFRPESLKIPEVNEFSFLISADKLMQRFSQFKDGDNKVTLLTVLKELEVPDNIVGYIRNTYEKLGMTIR